MEVLLAITVAALGTAFLVIAVSFRARIDKHAKPLMEQTKQDLENHVKQAVGEMRHEYEQDRAERDRQDKSQDTVIRNHETAIKNLGDTVREGLEQLDQLMSYMNHSHPGVQDSLSKLQRGEADIRQSLSRLSAGLRGAEESIKQVHDDETRREDARRQQIAGLERSAVSRAVAVGRSVDDLRKELDGTGRKLNRLYDSLSEALRQADSTSRTIGDVVRCMRRWANSPPEGVGSLRVVPGSLAPDPYSAQIAWKLARVLWSALSMDLLFRYGSSTGSTYFFLAWNPSPGQSAEECVGALFTAILRPEVPENIVGLDELRGLLIAFYEGGPAALQIGSAVVARTPDELLAGVLPAGLSGADGALPGQQGAYAGRLRQADVRMFADLTEWARNYGQ